MGDPVEVKHNVLVSPSAERVLLNHYMERDQDHPFDLNVMPKLIYVLAYKDGDGNVIDGEPLGYRLVRGEPKYTNDKYAFPFENGKKFFIIEFSEDDYESDCQYNLDYDGTVFSLLKDNFDHRTIKQLT